VPVTLQIIDISSQYRQYRIGGEYRTYRSESVKSDIEHQVASVDTRFAFEMSVSIFLPYIARENANSLDLDETLLGVSSESKQFGINLVH